MEDAELKERLERLEKMMLETSEASAKTQKYIRGLVIGSVLVVVLPLIGLMFEIPSFIAMYGQISQIGGM